MTIQEAIKKCGDNKWIRPVRWKGVAIRVRDSKLDCVPSERGGFSYSPTVADLLGDWEVVDPTAVCDEMYA